MSEAIGIAVVGHTNTGKTSLIRTLLRSDKFGAVANRASTTRHVERAAILVDGQEMISLFDTPGLEDSSALLELLQSLETENPNQSISQFLQSLDQFPDFVQEAKVLKQGQQSEALLYVVDVRLAPLEKYWDEIKILSLLGKPIIPVFNFINETSAQLEQWREMMISHNLHSAVAFDTVAFDFEAEKRLYQKLQSVLEQHYEQFQKVIDARAKAWQTLCEAAVRRTVDMIADTAVYRTTPSADGQNEKVMASMQEDIRKLEQRCLKDLLRLFDFSSDDVELLQLPVHQGNWSLDLFSPNTLKLFGLNAGRSAITGAAAGAGIDLILGGLSLGAATALGAIVGAGYSTGRRFGRQLKSTFLGEHDICADEATVALLYLRSLFLLRQLTRRGHASIESLVVDENPSTELPADWANILKGLRSGQASREHSNTQYWDSRTRCHDALIHQLQNP